MSAQFFLGNQDKLVASHRRFPIQPIALIQHDLVAFRVSRHGTAGGGKKDIDLVNVQVLAHLIRGKHDRWMVSLAEGTCIDIPLLHGEAAPIPSRLWGLRWLSQSAGPTQRLPHQSENIQEAGWE